MASDLIGRSLGHFRVVEKIGEGGMGVVYVAMDQRLRRTVALKVLRPEIADDPRRRGRFLREARFAASLAHPNVCMVHEVGESDGLVYMAMELLEGSSLRVRLARGRLPAVQALTIARDIARALARAHEKGIIHRDLKPDNVIVYEPNPGVLAAKVLDFGLAKALDVEAKSPEHENTATFVTAHGVAIGTPGYMAPEQAKGLEVDARADVYSFGVMLFEMLTGRSPYKGRSPEELIAAAGREELRPPSELVRGLSRDVDAFYMRCCDRTINRRFPNGAALVNALHPLLEPNANAKVSGGGSGAFEDVTAEHSPRGRTLQPAAATVSVAGVPGVPSLLESVDFEDKTRLRPPTPPSTIAASVVETPPITDVSEVSLVPVEQPQRFSSAPPPPVPLSISSGARAPQRSGVRVVHFLGFVAMGVLAFFVARMAVITTTSASASIATTPTAVTTTANATNVAASSSSPAPSASTNGAALADDVVVEPSAPTPKAVKTGKSHRAARPSAPAAQPVVAPVTSPPAAAPAPAPPAEDCSNPFYVNSEGIRVPKRQCLR